MRRQCDTMGMSNSPISSGIVDIMLRGLDGCWVLWSLGLGIFIGGVWGRVCGRIFCAYTGDVATPEKNHSRIFSWGKWGVFKMAALEVILLSLARPSCGGAVALSLKTRPPSRWGRDTFLWRWWWGRWIFMRVGLFGGVGLVDPNQWYCWAGGGYLCPPLRPWWRPPPLPPWSVPTKW